VRACASRVSVSASVPRCGLRRRTTFPTSNRPHDLVPCRSRGSSPRPLLAGVRRGAAVPAARRRVPAHNASRPEPRECAVRRALRCAARVPARAAARRRGPRAASNHVPDVEPAPPPGSVSFPWFVPAPVPVPVHVHGPGSGRSPAAPGACAQRKSRRTAGVRGSARFALCGTRVGGGGRSPSRSAGGVEPRSRRRTGPTTWFRIVSVVRFGPVPGPAGGLRTTQVTPNRAKTRFAATCVVRRPRPPPRRPRGATAR
jgi:hypothetical protein